MFYGVLLGTTSSDMTVIDITSTTHITVTSTPSSSSGWISKWIIILSASIGGLLVLVVVVVLVVLICIIVIVRRCRKCGKAKISNKVKK